MEITGFKHNLNHRQSKFCRLLLVLLRLRLVFLRMRLVFLRMREGGKIVAARGRRRTFDPSGSLATAFSATFDGAPDENREADDQREEEHEADHREDRNHRDARRRPGPVGCTQYRRPEHCCS